MKRNKRSSCTRRNLPTPYHRSTNIENRSDAQASTSANRPGFKFIEGNLEENQHFKGYPDDKFKKFIISYIKDIKLCVFNEKRKYSSFKDIVNNIIKTSNCFVSEKSSLKNERSDIHIKQVEYSATFLKDIIYFGLYVLFTSNENITKNDLQGCIVRGGDEASRQHTYTFHNTVKRMFNDYTNYVFHSFESSHGALTGDTNVSPDLIDKNNECFNSFETNKRMYRILNMSINNKLSMAEFVKCLISIVNDNEIVVEEGQLFERMCNLITRMISSDKVECIYPMPDIFKAVKAFFQSKMMHNTEIDNVHKFVRVVSLITCQLNKEGIIRFSTEELTAFLEQKDDVFKLIVHHKVGIDDGVTLNGQGFFSIIYAKYIIAFCTLLLGIQGEIHQDKINEASEASAAFVDSIIDELAKQCSMPQNGCILYYSTIPKILSFFNKHEIIQKQPAVPGHFHESPNEGFDDIEVGSMDGLEGIEINPTYGIFALSGNMTQQQLETGANYMSGGGAYSSSNDYGYVQTQQRSRQPVLTQNYWHNNTNIDGFVDLNDSNNMAQQQYPIAHYMSGGVASTSQCYTYDVSSSSLHQPYSPSIGTTQCPVGLSANMSQLQLGANGISGGVAYSSSQHVGPRYCSELLYHPTSEPVTQVVSDEVGLSINNNYSTTRY